MLIPFQPFLQSLLRVVIQILVLLGGLAMFFNEFGLTQS